MYSTTKLRRQYHDLERQQRLVSMSGEVQSSPLGIYAKSNSARTEPATDAQAEAQRAQVLDLATVTRFALQNGARELMPGERVAGCCRWRAYGHETVDVIHLPHLKRARYGGLQTCASVWMCPPCAAKISERRKLDMTKGLIAAEQKGYHTLMVTYTVRHSNGDPLDDLVSKMATARKSLKCGRAAAKMFELSGVVGTIRALEVTHHDPDADPDHRNGWHPHIHELIILEHLDYVGHLLEFLRTRWESAVGAAGLRPVNSRAFDWTLADTEIAEYVAKFGHSRAWNVEHEMTKQVSKKGRAGNLSPIDLLSRFTFSGDLVCGALWTEYARAMKGSRQLFWSKGLRALLLPADPDLSDEELAEQSDELGIILGSLPPKVWRLVVANDARAQLLNVAAAGDWERVVDFVLDLDRTAQTTDPVLAVEEMLERGRGHDQRQYERTVAAVRAIWSTTRDERKRSALADLINSLDISEGLLADVNNPLWDRPTMQPDYDRHWLP